MVKYWLRVTGSWDVSPLVKAAYTLAKNCSLQWTSYINRSWTKQVTRMYGSIWALLIHKGLLRIFSKDSKISMPNLGPVSLKPTQGSLEHTN